MDLPESGFVVYWMLFASCGGQLSCTDLLNIWMSGFVLTLNRPQDMDIVCEGMPIRSQNRLLDTLDKLYC